MDWKCCGFRQLTADQLYLILRARNTVLVVEDAHVHLDIDGKDEYALHVFALETGDKGPSIGAYARLLPGDEFDPEVRIDKFLTSATRRDDSTPEQLIHQALSLARQHWPSAPIRIHAPKYHEAFYERFGFRKADGPFLEHGMPYIGMVFSPRAAAKTLRGLLRAVRGGASDSHQQYDGQALPSGADSATLSQPMPADSGVNR
jgi:predicted GNAT family N-acyltransferase